MPLNYLIILLAISVILFFLLPLIANRISKLIVIVKTTSLIKLTLKPLGYMSTRGFIDINILAHEIVSRSISTIYSNKIFNSNKIPSPHALAAYSLSLLIDDCSKEYKIDPLDMSFDNNNTIERELFIAELQDSIKDILVDARDYRNILGLTNLDIKYCHYAQKRVGSLPNRIMSVEGIPLLLTGKPRFKLGFFSSKRYW